MKTVVRLAAALLMISATVLLTATSAQASSPKWLSISVGGTHTCGIRTDHALYCWGVNDYGQLGDGTTDPHQLPTRVGTSNSWSSVTAGALHTCGLRSG